MEKYTQNRDIAWRMVDGEAVLVVPSESRVMVLNETAGALWEVLETPKSAVEMAETLARRFEVDLETARLDVDEFVARFHEKNLINRIEEESPRA